MSSSRAQSPHNKKSPGTVFENIVRRYAHLWPCILGFAFCRIGVSVSIFNSFGMAGEGFLGNVWLLVSLVVLTMAFLYLFIKKSRLSERAVIIIASIGIVLEALALFGLAITDFLGIRNETLDFVFSILASFITAWVLSYWLRLVRGSSTATGLTFVFTALIISEVSTILIRLLPEGPNFIIAGVIVLLQFPCMYSLRKIPRPFELEPLPGLQTESFGFAKTIVSSRLFLASSGLGIVMIALIVGLLKGYPDGLPTNLTFPTHMAYVAIAVVLSIGVIAIAFHGKFGAAMVGIWVVLQILTCCSLISYAAFPEYLEIGALFANVLNLLMAGFIWYMIIALMSLGWRDPYLYAAIGWFSFLAPRAVARLILFHMYPFTGNAGLMNASIATLLVLSTQVILIMYIMILRKEHTRKNEAEDARSNALEKLLGFNGNENLSGAREAFMRHNAEEIGKQFLLSDREIEVLTLYALGFTQKRVAEELYITPATAHAHVKRIYAKTGFHSRQEILDYMKKYAS